MADFKPVLDEWRNQPLEKVLELYREWVEDPEYPLVDRWREQGGKVVGHFQVYFPEEIVHAAGMLPVKICGARTEGMEAQSHFGSYLCSIVKTSLELALTGKVKLDAFVTHPICDAARNLAAIWSRNFPYKCQILYLPQNPNSRHSHRYLTGEYRRLQGDVEEVAGRKIEASNWERTLAIYNRSRQLIHRLYQIKRDTPWLIAAEDAYALLAVAGMVPREEHNEMLAWALEEIGRRKVKAQDRMRVVFEGAFCEQPPLDLIQTIGRSCYIVDDDFLIGLRWIEGDVLAQGNPLENLARSYLENSTYSPVQHDLGKPKEEMLLRRIKESKAEAAVIGAAKMCEPGLEEQVTYSLALDEREIPYFVTEFEENQTTFNSLSIQLETFVENLLFQ